MKIIGIQQQQDDAGITGISLLIRTESRSNITNHVPIAGGAGERGHQPADAPPQQVKILFYSFEQKIYLTCYKKIFQELAAAAPAQLQRVRVHTEAGACPAGARGRVHVQTSRSVR